MAKSVLVALRLPAELKAEIDKLVASGKVKSASEFIRKALEQQLLKEAS